MHGWDLHTPARPRIILRPPSRFAGLLVPDDVRLLVEACDRLAFPTRRVEEKLAGGSCRSAPVTTGYSLSALRAASGPPSYLHITSLAAERRRSSGRSAVEESRGSTSTILRAEIAGGTTGFFVPHARSIPSRLARTHQPPRAPQPPPRPTWNSLRSE